MEEKKDYEVGYGKPPKAARFRKGQSGNPSGKPKKILTSAEIINRDQSRMVKITVDDKPGRLTVRELMYKAVVK